MDSVSYFEMGNEVISTSLSSPSHSASSFRGAPTTQPVSQVQAKRNTKVAGGRKADHTSTDDWGPAEAFGYGLGLGAGIAFAVITFPVVAADGPLIGPADLIWLGASIRTMDATTRIGRSLGSAVDDQMGW